MELPYRVENLDDVPESARELYEETDGGFRLPVTGVESEEEVSGLKSALAKVKRDLRAAKDKAGRVSEEDLEELERLRELEHELEEQKAKDEGRLEEWKAEWKERAASKYEKELEELRQKVGHRDKVVESLTVTNAIRSAISEAGVDPRYHRAVEHLLRNEYAPKVDWESGDMPRGIFSDDIEGDVPISEFVQNWAKSDEASPYMPRETGAGGGGHGTEGRGGGESWRGKKYADMTTDEKIAYSEATYGEGAAA